MTAQIKVPIVVNMNMDEIIERLKKDDFVQVVRCKDCKYYTGYECQRSKVSNIRVITNEDDYCSRAERKADDER